MTSDNVLLILTSALGIFLIMFNGDSNGYILVALGITNRYLADIYKAIDKVQMGKISEKAA